MTLYNGDCLTSVLPDAFTVTAGDEPITGLTATNNSPTELGSLTTLTATIETGTNVTFTWDFDDGSTGSGGVTQHEYAAVGTYVAKVTATNATNTLSTTTEVTIFIPEPEIHNFYLPMTFKD
jgi:PKD repeat protein